MKPVNCGNASHGKRTVLFAVRGLSGMMLKADNYASHTAAYRSNRAASSPAIALRMSGHTGPVAGCATGQTKNRLTCAPHHRASESIHAAAANSCAACCAISSYWTGCYDKQRLGKGRAHHNLDRLPRSKSCRSHLPHLPGICETKCSPLESPAPKFVFQKGIGSRVVS